MGKRKQPNRVCIQCGKPFYCRPSILARDACLFCSGVCRDDARTMTPDKFWSRVDFNGPIPEHCPELGPCWLWTGAVHTHGYGMCRSPDRTLIRAHRLAFCFDTGREPELNVLHKCDRRICVRPSHLFEGTHKDNIQDCIEKGRFKGNNNLLLGRQIWWGQVKVRSRAS